MLEYHPAEFVPVIRFIAIHIAHGLFSRSAARMARAGLDLAIAARPLKRARAVALGASARLGIWNAHIVHDFVPLFDCWCLTIQRLDDHGLCGQVLNNVFLCAAVCYI